MELRTLGQLMAERKYKLLTSSGAKEEVIVRIGVPQESPDRRDFFCPFEIVGLGTPKIKCAFGIDAVQALQLTMKIVGAEMYHHRKQFGDGLYTCLKREITWAFRKKRGQKGLAGKSQEHLAPSTG